MASKSQRVVALYGGQDPRKLPAYTLREAAAYLSLPQSTVRTWVLGRQRRTAEGEHHVPGVVKPAALTPCRLSFLNLVEVHVLRSIRNTGVKLETIRRAVAYLRRHMGKVEAPLAHQQMQTDGVSLFIECLGSVIDIGTGHGQIAIREAMLAHLERIDRDPTGLAARLYPFPAGDKDISEARPFSIDPRVRFGRLCLTGTGITADDLYSRWKAAEPIEALAKDFDRPPEEIERALRQFHTAA